ncbi:MAG TPA: hypothetical protein VEZ90_12890, partial [Blastocatellia bacterium]|nr:hypothetical protein [Blastocatellia bacterium]
FRRTTNRRLPLFAGSLVHKQEPLISYDARQEEEMNCYLINATSIKAFWGFGHLFLTASGHCECTKFANISESPMTIFPPQYQITTCPCPIIGSFPYDVHAWFVLEEKPESVIVHTASGAQKVDVHPFAVDSLPDLTLPAVLTATPADDEVIGISPNSWDVNRAITNAVSKLQKLFPANVNATVVETGVVAVGTPVGIAFLYVKMKQIAADKSAGKRKS